MTFMTMGGKRNSIVSIALLIMGSLLFCLSALAFENDGIEGRADMEDLLLVVGDVSSHHARILYENLKPIEKMTYKVFLYQQPLEENGSNHLMTRQSKLDNHTLEAIHKPKILKLNNLVSHSKFSLFFCSKDVIGNNFNVPSVLSSLKQSPLRLCDLVTFKTFPNEDDEKNMKSKMKIVSTSCNRYYEDGDGEMMEQLAQDESDRHAMIHLGDQIYADWITRKYITNSQSDGSKKIQVDISDLVEQFRDSYRVSWGNRHMQKILRNGANWMLPDDHDIVNNLDSWMFTTTDEIRKNITLAGRMAFYEYQFQLKDDIFEDKSNSLLQYTDAVKNDIVYFSKNIMDTCWIFLDFRFQRTFQYDKESPLIGNKQFAYLESKLKECSSTPLKLNHINQKRPVFLLVSVPILFLTESFAKLTYLVEKEKYTNYPELKNDTLRLLDLLTKYSEHLSINIIAGDVHHFAKSEICNHAYCCQKNHHQKDECVCFNQMRTSGLTIASTVSKEFKLFLANLFNLIFQPSIDNWVLCPRDKHSSQLQHYIGRNYGRIELNPIASKISPQGKQQFYVTIDMNGVGAKDEPLKHRILQWISDHVSLMGYFLVSSILVFVSFCYFHCGRSSRKTNQVKVD